MNDNTPTIKPVFYTPDEVAALLRTTVGRLRSWRHEGGGPVYAKVGIRVMYPIAEVEKFIAAITVSRD
ncbi:helix-turn-helix domain-containing protein [[Mycobacterium] zoologicum]|uniref:helix-turn-helix domain-containing protein n=1 Tax=[Mycobacterium] zoologicum TaxID=2872311 RepID=UPI001CDB4365|nr:helix-turn-helix domain-containing protein [Mycolicibacter sp. MYC101]MEB3065399.1 helix-turn-helix domain-containing protein [Mycolicibacter sp. MYC101]